MMPFSSVVFVKLSTSPSSFLVNVSGSQGGDLLATLIDIDEADLTSADFI